MIRLSKTCSLGIVAVFMSILARYDPLLRLLFQQVAGHA
jgi:hypothetical protein